MVSEPQLTDEQRVFLALEKAKGTTVRDIKKSFTHKWPESSALGKKTIARLSKKLLENQTVKNLNKGNSGRKRSASTQETIAAVENLPK